MEATINALGGILLRAIPTFLLVVFLYLYLKHMFFRPMEKVLDARYQATEGTRKLAEKTLALAAEQAAQYETAIRTARSGVYQAQEQLHKQLQEREAAAVAEARAAADRAVRQAREALACETAAARETLAHDSEALAERIAERILQRSAA
jgi:F-type H+-transporting ATPase subunit b